MNAELYTPLCITTEKQPQYKIQHINEYWESVFTEVVDVNAKEIFARMFENEEMLYHINFDGTTKSDSTADWKN